MLVKYHLAIDFRAQSRVLKNAFSAWDSVSNARLGTARHG